MNNLTLTFSGAALSRLRTLVATVDKEIAHDSGAATAAAGSQTPKSALFGATRRGHCWTSLPTPGSREKWRRN